MITTMMVYGNSPTSVRHAYFIISTYAILVQFPSELVLETFDFQFMLIPISTGGIFFCARRVVWKQVSSIFK